MSMSNNLKAHKLSQDPAIDTMNRQMHTLNEDTDRFYANIGPRPQFMSSAPAKGKSQEANMSFERMMRAITSASVPMMPCEVNPELNPAVEAFTPSDSSDKGPVKSDNMQASTLSKDELKPSVITKPSTADGSVPPHLRLFSKISTQKELVTTGLSTADKSVLPHLRLFPKILTQKEPVITGLSTADKSILPHLRPFPKISTEKKPVITSPSIADESVLPVLPHLRLIPKVLTQKESVITSSSMADKTVLPHLRLLPKISIQEDPATITKESSVKNKIKDHGTVATSTNSELTKEAEPLKATSMTSGAINHLTYRDLIVENEGATPGHDVSAKITSEKENNTAFLLEYNKVISMVSEKYGKNPRKSLATPKYQINPIKFGRVKPSYVPPKPVGTHEIGSLLDDECYRMVMKPRKGVKMADIGQWKGVIKNGEVVYVLCENEKKT